MNIIAAWLEARFRRKLSVKIIQEYFAGLRLEKSCQSVEKGDRRVLRVSCVQRTILPVKKVESYIDMLHYFIKKAVNDGSELVVFPEYNFLDLSGMIPGFTWLNRYLSQKFQHTCQKDFAEDEHVAKMNGLSPMIFFAALAGALEPAIELIFSHFARGYGIYIYSGSYVIRDGDGIVNVGSLYGPDGQQIGRQAKLHLLELEIRMGMGAGKRLEVHDLPVGRVVCPVCMDATYFETFQIAKELRANLVLLPIANAEEYNVWKALKGIWPRVQEAAVYGVKASLNGWLIGMHYTGKAGIFAPVAITPNRDGVIALARSHEGNEVISADLDFDILEEFRKSAEYFGDRNPIFEEEYVTKTYREEE